MTTTYFGFAIADSMLPEEAVVCKRKLSIEEAKKLIQGSVPCINFSHTATIKALVERFGIQVHVPKRPPIVNLQFGDVLIVMSVRGLPRLTDRHHYTSEEIEGASFIFSKYEIFAHYRDYYLKMDSANIIRGV